MTKERSKKSLDALGKALVKYLSENGVKQVYLVRQMVKAGIEMDAATFYRRINNVGAKRFTDKEIDCINNILKTDF